jgi:hypothetical protein
MMLHVVAPPQPFTVHDPEHETLQVPAPVQSIVPPFPDSTVHALLFEQS